MRLVVSMPTRGRPQQLAQTIQRNLACLSEPNSLLMVQVDEDDIQTVELAKKLADKRLKFSILPREDTIAAKWNRALTEEADVYTCLGDDDPLLVRESDVRILEAARLFPDKIGMVYGHLANASFSGVISFTRKMTELLGFIQPEYFPYWFCDHWTDDIGRIVGRIAFADVRTDQSKVGKTMELREPAWWATWFDAAYMRRREEACNVIMALDEPDWRKEILRTHAPLIEFRSRWINDNVRMNARNLETWGAPKDERYLRVKQKAIDTVPLLLRMLPTEHEVRVFRELLTPPPFITNLPRAWATAA